MGYKAITYSYEYNHYITSKMCIMFKMAWGKQDPQYARYKKKMMKTIWTVIMKNNVSLKTGCKDWICGKGEWQIHDIINHFEQRAHMPAHAQLLRKSHGIAIKRIRAFIYISVIKINLLPQEEFLLSTLQSTPSPPGPYVLLQNSHFQSFIVSDWNERFCQILSVHERRILCV